MQDEVPMAQHPLSGVNTEEVARLPDCHCSAICSTVNMCQHKATAQHPLRQVSTRKAMAERKHRLRSPVWAAAADNCHG